MFKLLMMEDIMISKLKALFIVGVCCLVLALCSETRCMDTTSFQDVTVTYKVKNSFIHTKYT